MVGQTVLNFNQFNLLLQDKGANIFDVLGKIETIKMQINFFKEYK